MKLSFSANGWEELTIDECIELATEMHFSGIELHGLNIADSLELGELSFIKRKLNLARLEIPCIDASYNIANPERTEQNIAALEAYLLRAFKLKVKYIRVYASKSVKGEEACDESEESVKKVIDALLPKAKELGVVVLVETAGLYADTLRLKNLLDSYADDYLAALWDIHHTFRKGHEDPQQTITNLGAYVKHVHLKDSVEGEGLNRYRLMGEGTLPITEAVNALKSINYDGFLSLELNPKHMEDFGEAQIVFPHYVSYMSRFEDTARNAPTLYDNKSKTGKFIWKKDALIDLSFPQVLDKMAETFPDQYAFKYTTLNYTRTYSQFREDVDAFARALIALNVKNGDHVAVWATNIPQWYIAFWAVTKIGAVLVSMNTAYKIHEAEYLLRQSDTHTLIMIDGYRDSNYAQIISELCPELSRGGKGALHIKRLPFLRNIITVGFELSGCLSWEEALDKSERVPVEELSRRTAEVDEHDVANMQYTSGTTGFPKGVMLTHHNIVNNGKCIGDRMDLSTADRMMIQVPMFHCFGMVLAMTASMTHGATLCPLPYFSARPALACINQEKITAFHGVPTMFIAMLEHPDFATTDFSYMRTGIMAGSPCPVAVMKDVVEKMNMREITIVYGQTEASPGCTMSSADDPLQVRVETVGRCLPEIECKIIDPETGADLADDTVGEFVARGYNIMKGYYKMPRATKEAIDSSGWLHTGDLACRTPEGNFKITGRLKDMIIRGGENIYPKEIEEFLYTHPMVKDVSVIGVPDEMMGEEIMAWVILKNGQSISEKEMKNFVSEHMAKHKTPKYIRFVEQFPTNVAGKILKYKMREEAIALKEQGLL